jgi:peptidylprolyl isomerase
MSRARWTARAVAVTAITVLVLAGCGDDGTPVKDASAAKDKPAIPTLSVPVDAAGKKCKAATGVTKKKGKPTVEMPAGQLPPKKLVTKDLKVGTGATAALGDSIEVQYVGIACSTGKQFDSSWDRDKPFDTPLTDASGLIKGWTEGIPGMKVGGRRMLTIPSDLAYGAAGSGDIRQNEALVFVIDLLKVTPASATTTTTSAPAGGSSTTTTGGSTTTTTAGSTTTTGG